MRAREFCINPPPPPDPHPPGFGEREVPLGGASAARALEAALEEA